MTAKEFFIEHLSGEPLTQESIIEALDIYYSIKKDIENNLPNEIWVDIPMYTNVYQVSNLGRVKSLDRIIENKKNQIQRYKGRLISPRLSSKGYYQVSLSENNKTSMFSVHRLVMLGFKGYSELPVDHINRKTTDNRLENLRYLTHNLNVLNKESKGYWWNKRINKWQSKIQIDNKPIHLGVFDNELDAQLAYKTAKEKYHVIK